MKKINSSYIDGFRGTITVFLCAFILVFSAFSCDSGSGASSTPSGKVRITLHADTTSLKRGVSSNPTKALPDEFEKFQTTDDYKIEIVQGETSVKTFDRFDQMPSEIELPEGAYTFVASKGDDKAAAFENPFFEGNSSFTVKEDMSTPLDVTCTLANARVTVDYTEEFKKAYTSYTTTLSSSFVNSQLPISQKESRPAYMQVAKEGTTLSVAISLKKLETDAEKTYRVLTPIPMERRQNIHLIFKTDGGATNGIGLDILLDNQLEKSDTIIKIPDFMLPEISKQQLSSLKSNYARQIN